MYSIKKNIKSFILLLLLINGAVFNLKAQTWDWVETIRPGGNEYCWDLTNDAQGNVLATGRVKANSTFGSGAFVQSPAAISLSETDMFIAKYRPNGNLVWVKRQGGKEPDWGRAVATDKYSNVFVTGDYCDTAMFGVHQLIADGPTNTRNVFLSKYDSLGTCLWAVSASSTTLESKGFGVTADSIGNSYITGYVIGVTKLDTVTFGVAGKTYGFVAKFNPNGRCLWSKTFNAQYSSIGEDLKINKNGDLAVVGSYRGTLYINSLTFPGNSPSWSDVFVVKMDTLGNFIWARTAIGAFQDQPSSVDFDSDGNIYVGGAFANDLTFGTTTINSLGWGATATVANAKIDGFIAKYSNSGVFKWVRTIGNSQTSPYTPLDLSLDDLDVNYSNKILVSGYVIGNVNMSGIPLALDTARETGYVTAFDTSGNVLWYKLTGAVNNDAFVARGVSSDSNGNCFLGGEFYGSPMMDFDSITVQSYSGWDGLIGKLYPPLNPIIIADTLLCPGQVGNFSAMQDGFPLTYQWTFAGGTPATSTLENPTVNYSVVGTYSATLIIANPHQSDTTTFMIQVTPAACGISVQEYVNNINVTIAPNPVSSSATIYIDGIDLNSKPTFQLYDYLGRSIGSPLLITDLSFPLNVESIASGGYFFKIIQNSVVVKTGKMIILH